MFIFKRGEIEFEVVYVAPEIDSDDENVDYEDETGHRYRLYLDELEESRNAAVGRNDGSGDAKPLAGKRLAVVLSIVVTCLEKGNREW